MKLAPERLACLHPPHPSCSRDWTQNRKFYRVCPGLPMHACVSVPADRQPIITLARHALFFLFIPSFVVYLQSFTIPRVGPSRHFYHELVPVALGVSSNSIVWPTWSTNYHSILTLPLRGRAQDEPAAAVAATGDARCANIAEKAGLAGRREPRSWRICPGRLPAPAVTNWCNACPRASGTFTSWPCTVGRVGR